MLSPPLHRSCSRPPTHGAHTHIRIRIRMPVPQDLPWVPQKSGSFTSGLPGHRPQMASAAPSPPPNPLRHLPPGTVGGSRRGKLQLEPSGACVTVTNGLTAARPSLPWERSPEPPGAERILQRFPWRGPCCSPVLCSSGRPSFTPAAPGPRCSLFPSFSHDNLLWLFEAAALPLPRIQGGPCPELACGSPVPGARSPAHGPQACHSTNLLKEPRISPKEC